MIGDGMAKGQPPRYRWFLGALAVIARKEGLRGLYSGLGANVGRASALAAGEMASYDAMKPWNTERLKMEEGLLLHAVTATQAYIVMACVVTAYVVRPSVSTLLRNEIPAKPRGFLGVSGGSLWLWGK